MFLGCSVLEWFWAVIKRPLVTSKSSVDTSMKRIFQKCIWRWSKASTLKQIGISATTQLMSCRQIDRKKNKLNLILKTLFSSSCRFAAFESYVFFFFAFMLRCFAKPVKGDRSLFCEFALVCLHYQWTWRVAAEKNLYLERPSQIL